MKTPLKVKLWMALRLPIVAYRKLVCKIAGHKMEWTGYYEAAKQGSSFNKIEQCARCRWLDRSQPGTVVIRLGMENPYER